ncbi:MAG: 16S rRNA (guanine(966)-N(2))-methyltransferase RsmD [Deltaproteobacteria bacterium]|nr:16S rRNA (guanine(966)-N(2))-methyltransferase RsmD [Deltaproteobacteria bacterium]
MRIISGLAKGRRLATPKSPLIRPVSDKVKEAIFNILGPIDGETVLDLFAGTGSVGLEAASRGAAKVVLVDGGEEGIRLIRKNIAVCGFEETAVAVKGILPRVLEIVARKNPPFNLVFVDPPYDKGLIDPTLQALVSHKLIDAQSRVIIEHSPREIPSPTGLGLTDSRKYGQTIVSFYHPLPGVV